MSSSPEPPSFHLRMPQKLKEELQAARGRNSLNTEIVQRLERSVEPDPAQQLADIFRPILSKLSAAEQVQLVEQVASAVKIVARAQKRKRAK